MMPGWGAAVAGRYRSPDQVVTPSEKVTSMRSGVLVTQLMGRTGKSGIRLGRNSRDLTVVRPLVVRVDQTRIAAISRATATPRLRHLATRRNPRHAFAMIK